MEDLYEGSQLWRSDLRSAEDIMLIKRLMDNQDVSIWKLHPKQAEFLVRREKKLYVHRQLRASKLNHTVLIMDVQRRINNQTVEPDQWNKQSLRRGHRMNWQKYPPLDILNEYINFLAKNYPSICKIKVIGKSFENRSIMMLTISNGNPSNKGIIVNAGAHAREWIAISSALVILRELITKYDDQPSYVKDTDWYVIPLQNPDGYYYSHKEDRLWRKNRRPLKNKCLGVDLNRNFKTTWFVSGISETNECGESYGGTEPFSEPEVIALRDTVLELKRRGRLNASIDLHSYGQVLYLPWSGRLEASQHDKLLKATAADICTVILMHTRTKYKYGQTYRIAYPATGSYLDWVHDIGMAHAYVIEGRDKGRDGFLVSPTEIEAAGKEMFVAVKHMARILNDKTKTKDSRKAWL